MTQRVQVVADALRRIFAKILVDRGLALDGHELLEAIGGQRISLKREPNDCTRLNVDCEMGLASILGQLGRVARRSLVIPAFLEIVDVLGQTPLEYATRS